MYMKNNFRVQRLLDTVGLMSSDHSTSSSLGGNLSCLYDINCRSNYHFIRPNEMDDTQKNPDQGV